MKNFLFILFVCLLSSCYKKLELEGFDSDMWKKKGSCSDYRIESVKLLTKNSNLILEATQNEVESLLGAADEHELYERNQKFLHYRLSPPDTCQNATDTLRFLSIRFNAIGRASDIQLVIRE